MRKTIFVLLSCTVVLLVGYCGYRAYELWKQNHWMTLAKTFASRGDAKNEGLCLQQALRFNPRDIEACRMMASISTGQNAVVWREKAVEFDPGSLDDRLALAQAAMLISDLNTAGSALAGVDAAGKKTAAYYNVSGEFALSSGKPDEAEADFAEAARLDPSNPTAQFSLAYVELRSTNSLDAAEGRISLRRISMTSTNFFVRSQARRELIMDALRSKDDNTALSISAELVEGSHVVFPDKLLRLDALWAAKSGTFKPALADCEHEAANGAGQESDKLVQLTLWMMGRNMTGQAVAWLQSLPVNIQTNLPAAPLLAQGQMLLQQWGGLQTSISRENWGELDFIRHAYIARAMRQQGYVEASKAEWEIAVQTASAQRNRLTALVRLTAEWNWQEEAQELLWIVVKNYPEEQWADQALAGMLYKTGSTRPLMQLFNIESNHNPSDLDAKNNLALTAMLLKAQELNPYDLTRQVYQKDPTNSFFECTYGFSLYLQGKNAQALKIMQQIPPQYLYNATAGYYGLILKANGNSNAGAYLNRSLKGQLLPEERALFQHAASGS